MKAKELMIGDWVRNDLGEYQTVVELRESGAMLAYNDIYPYDAIEPIPITPEILEKNLGVVERSSDGYNLVINRELILAFHLEATLDFWIAQPSDWPHLTYSLPLPRYVHELQHALRLCRIDKEIVL